MAVSFCLKSQVVRRLLAVVMICSLLPGSFAWGALQPPLGKTTNPVFGTSGGTVPATVPPNLSPYIKDVPAAIQLGKALFWDMQAGSDGVTACASCHYRAGADPVIGSLPNVAAKRDTNQLHPGPDFIFGNNSTVIRTQKIDPVTLLPVVDPVTGLPVSILLRATGLPQFAPNYTLQQGDFSLFLVKPPTARLLLVDPVTGLAPLNPLTAITTDPVTSISDTNDVVGSQGVRLADFLAININSAIDSGTPLIDTTFHIGTPPNINSANNTRQVTGRNAPSVINAVFNYSNFWDGRANNIFNGENPFGPLDQTAGIWNDNGVSLVKQPVAITNASLASQATGPAMSSVEMSFRGRTFPELGRKMLSLPPLAQQLVSPADSVLGTLSLQNTTPGARGLVPSATYTQMIQAAFQTNLTSTKTVNLPTVAVPAGEPFTQIEANFSLFWGLAIQLYEATLVSDQAPFDLFQAGNQNTLSVFEQRGFTAFDGKCALCHSGSEFTSAVVGSNNCPVTTLLTDCNPVAFTNNSSHSLIKQEVNPTTFAVNLIDTGFFNIGVRPTADDPGRGGSKLGFPLSFSKLAVQASQTGLLFVTPKLPFGFTTTDKVLGSFKTPGLRNVELTAPYFHNGDALTLSQVVEFYSRGGNFPGNPELAAAIQPLNLRNDPTGRSEIVAFLNKLTDERVRNETAPFDHPELMIHNGVDAISGADLLITLPATGGAPPPVLINTLTINPITSPTNLTSLPLSGKIAALEIVNGIPTVVFDKATVAVDVTNITIPAAPVHLPTLAATVGGALPDDWSINLTGLTPGSYSITVTATSITGVIKTLPVANVLITPAATITGVPIGGKTNLNSATLTIGGAGVVTYQFSLDGAAFSADTPVATPISLSSLPDGSHSVAVLGKDAGGNQQTVANATTASWLVKSTPPVLTLNATSSPTGSSTQTISGTVELGPFPAVSVDTSATVSCSAPIPGGGISTWSCNITGLVPGINNVTVVAVDLVSNISTVKGSITRILPDGNFKGTGVTDISDALKAMRIAVGLDQPTITDMLHGDVAPLVNGLPTQDNRIDIADALLILRKIVGLATF